MYNNKYDLDLAEEIINLKIANTIKNNNGKTFKTIEEEITRLQEEKEQLYKNNKKIIDKVLHEYIKDVKN